jgi:hypothetical protein
MKALIKEVNPGTVYQDKISDYWIKVQLTNGQNIEIFDATPYDLRNKINQSIECLVIATFIDIVNEPNQIKKPLLNGKFLGKYDISSKWENIFEGGNKVYKLASEWYAVDSEGSIFLVTLSNEDIKSLRKGDDINMVVGRYDLVAWYSIEE